MPLEILYKDWIDKPEVLAIFMHIIRSAEIEACEHDGVSLHRGQLCTSLGQLSKTTKQGKQVIRTCLSKLIQQNLIQTSSTKSNTIITVIRYDEYFEKPPQLPSPTQDKGEQQKKKPKKTREEIIADTLKRKQKFGQDLIPYIETYGKAMIRQFYDYWSEPNKSGSRMRFEQEKTWELSRRLCRWANNNKQYDRNGNKDQSTNAGERIHTAANLVNQLLSEQ